MLNAQQPQPRRFSRRQRIIATVMIALIAALAIATAQVLSSAQLIPAIWATISNALVGTLGMIFAFFALIPLLYAPADPQTPSTSVATPPLSSQPTQPTILPSSPVHAADTPSPEPSGTVWNVPFARNPFFTGRDAILTDLRSTLTSTQRAAITQPQAISGLGGIGKTQTAIEYAYRYQDDYQAVLWVRSSTREELLSDFITIATLLHLPEQDAQDQNIVVNAVKAWLETHTRWLLICDNADELDLLRAFLPAGNTGHILLTTRAQSMSGLAHKVTIARMGREEGALLLLRRTGLIAPDATVEEATETEHAKALELVQELDGLPLALGPEHPNTAPLKNAPAHACSFYRT